MNTKVRYGMPVMTSDGKRLGRVDRIVVNPDRKEFLEVVVQQYLPMPAERIVNRIDISRAGEDGELILKIDHDAAHKLPQLSAREFAVGTSDASATPFPLGAGPTTNQPILYQRGSSRHEMHAARSNVFESAVAGAAVVEVRSNLPDAAVILNKGIDVRDTEDRKVGTLDEVSFDEYGTITGFVIRTGFFTRHEEAVPADRIDAMTHKYVRLNVMSDERGMEYAEIKAASPTIAGVDDAYAARLQTFDIMTPDDLLEKGSTRAGRREIAEMTGIPEKMILKWVNHADLMRVKGVGTEYSELLEEAGVDTIPELATRKPENLYAKLVEVNADGKYLKVNPSMSQVTDWVSQAKSMRRMIEY